jgi:hypothetical protein
MSLAISYHELQKAVGRYLGYGRDVYGPDDGSAEWSDIEDCIRSGLRQFYCPPPLPGESLSYQWRFLKPAGTISLIAGTEDYDLSEDLAGIEGDFTYPPSQGAVSAILVSESALKTLRSKYPKSGTATHAAVRPKASDGTASQIFEVMFWPKPDSSITAQYRYYVMPQELSDVRPYPNCPAIHGESVLESCLSIAEQRLNDEKAIHWSKFLERLAASIQYDRRTNSLDFLGYNGDNSDRYAFSPNRADSITVNGQVIS